MLLTALPGYQAAHRDCAIVGGQDAAQQLYRGAFARAVGADIAQQLALLYLEGNMIKRANRAFFAQQMTVSLFADGKGLCQTLNVNIREGFLILLQHAVHFRRAFLAHHLAHIGNLITPQARAKANLQHVAFLYFGSGLRNLSVDGYAAAVTSLLRYGAALDDARHLQVFIQSHRELLI